MSRYLLKYHFPREWPQLVKKQNYILPLVDRPKTNIVFLNALKARSRQASHFISSPTRIINSIKHEHPCNTCADSESFVRMGPNLIIF